MPRVPLPGAVADADQCIRRWGPPGDRRRGGSARAPRGDVGARQRRRALASRRSSGESGGITQAELYLDRRAAVVYRIVTNGIIEIVAVMHGKRSPDYWKDRADSAPGPALDAEAPAIASTNETPVSGPEHSAAARPA